MSEIRVTQEFSLQTPAQSKASIVPDRDLERVKQGLKDIGLSGDIYLYISSVFIGIAVAGFFSLMTFTGVKDAEWKLAASWCALIVGIIAGVLCLVFRHSIEAGNRKIARVAITEIDGWMKKPDA